MIGKLILSFAVVVVGASSAFAQAGASFKVKIQGVEEAKGNILLSVFNDADAFPKDASKATHKVKVPAVKGDTFVTIQDVPAGEYAVAVVHDANSNDQMDTNGVGLPKEDFGFSNDAMGTFGPPSFKKAKVQVNAPATEISIRLKSM